MTCRKLEPLWHKLNEYEMKYLLTHNALEITNMRSDTEIRFPTKLPELFTPSQVYANFPLKHRSE